MTAVEEIKDALSKDIVIIGTDRTLKNMKQGKIAKVFVTRNCSDEVLSEINSMSKISNIEVVKLDKSNEDLGVVCKKPYSISVLSILKGV